MLNLAEYRRKDTRLADYLPWACLVAPGVVLNKDGSFQRTFRYRGPDLDSATAAELVAVTARLNNVVKRFGDGWALFFEAERIARARLSARPRSPIRRRGSSTRSGARRSRPKARISRAGTT